MATDPNAPVSPRDYGVLTTGWLSILGAILVGSRDHGEEPVRPVETIPLGVATFAMAKLISKEKIAAPERALFIDDEQRPKGSGVRYAIGELVTCTRCTGLWCALGLTGLRVLRPRESRVVNTLLGASAMNDFLQGCFSWTSARTNVAQVVEERAKVAPDEVAQARATAGART
jgi:hypothetical protein